MRRLLILPLLIAAGCSSSLDSGYEPRPLSASAAQRRAYYSSPYSEETQRALAEDHNRGDTFRPGY